MNEKTSVAQDMQVEQTWRLTSVSLYYRRLNIDFNTEGQL